MYAIKRYIYLITSISLLIVSNESRASVINVNSCLADWGGARVTNISLNRSTGGSFSSGQLEIRVTYPDAPAGERVMRFISHFPVDDSTGAALLELANAAFSNGATVRLYAESSSACTIEGAGESAVIKHWAGIRMNRQ